MRRRLLNWIALLSLFLFVLIVCLWISVAARFQLGSYYRKAMYATREPTGLGLTHQVFVGPTRFGSPRITVLFWWSRTYREYVGFRLEYGNFDDSSTIHRCLNLVIPFWAQALTVVTPAYWILSRARRRRNGAPGACEKCGYDLRATPERCPECGNLRSRLIQGAPNEVSHFGN